MSIEAEVSSQIVNQSLQFTESAAKLIGLGAKNLAALVLALAKDNEKLCGKTSIPKLLMSGKPPAVQKLKTEDIPKFKAEAKKYGLLYAIVKGEKDAKECEVIIREEDACKINSIFGKIGYATTKEQDGKNDPSRTPQGKKSNEFGNTSPTAPMKTTDDDKSVKRQVEAYKKSVAKSSGKNTRTRAKAKPKSKGK